jgi:hypothetical protein
MKWALVMMAMGTTPIQTNLVYDDLQACYAAEEKIAAEYADVFNQWLKRNGDTSLVPPYVKQRVMRGICTPHQSTVSAQSMETPPALRLEPRPPDAVSQSDKGDVGDPANPAMQKQLTNSVAALKNIKTLAQTAKDSDDVDALRKNFELTLTLANKALPRARKRMR